jgi:uncharacterized protein (DUF1684 family)
MDPYVEAVEAGRRHKDEAFRRDPNSPVPRHARAAFQGLRYYPVDPQWRFLVPLVPHPRPMHVTMQASDGAARQYVHVGHFALRVPAGQEIRVQAYEGAGHGLFIPFRDRTSGKDTYGAGRYLEVEPVEPHGDVYAVDFNLAYNPFCAYDDAFSCPFPPPENWLPIAVEAGEMTPH